MITRRPADDRGQLDHGWLDARHSFSFGHYVEPEHMGFRALRVLNEDRVQAGQGFGMHPHNDMEILTWVLEGALEHKDNMGNGSVIAPGTIQRMTAGIGVLHSEFNHSKEDQVHLMQIWILPEARGLTPGYEESTFADADLTNQLTLIAGHTPHGAAVKVHQDVQVFAARLDMDANVSNDLEPGRHAWVQVARGGLTLNGMALDAGDGAAISDETNLEFCATHDTELLLFDLA